MKNLQEYITEASKPVKEFEDASFTLVNGKWKQGRWHEAQY